MPRRSVMWAVVAGATAIAAVIAVSVVWPGLDAKKTPASDTSVWALQTGDGRRYARVNTAIGELDTVRSISNPSAVAQTGSGTYLFSQSYGKVTRIDEAMPTDLDDVTLRESPSTPPGTVEAAVAGDYVAYRTDSGAVFVGTLSHGAAQLELASGGSPGFTAQTVAVDDAGTLFAYSQSAGVVLRYSIPSTEVLGRDPVRSPPTSADVAITAAGGVWFLVDAGAGRVWHRGGGAPTHLSLVGNVAYGVPSATGDAAWIADETGLVRLPIDGTAPVRADGGTARMLGEPARPVMFGGVAYAAWLGPGEGTLWRSDRGESTLSYGGKSLPSDRKPAFVASDSSLILNETRTGWVWDATKARLLASSQDWSLDDQTDSQSEQSQQQAQVVIDPKPPVAEPDSFGVRAGMLVSLPVLLNDHDPNVDVLSIDPASVRGLDPAFGTVSVTDNGQRLAVQVAPDAQGAATFRYRDTDGTAADGGLYSPPTTVTLTVAAPARNTAPQWCGVEGCLAQWPSPEVAPGGTVSVPVLDGWVDPDGDPLMLLSAVDKSGVGSVAATPSGDVVYQHPDPSSTQAQIVQLQVVVGDTRGATTTKDLVVRVTPKPALTAQSFTVVDALSASGVTVDVGPHLTGTEGRMSLSSVRVLDDATADAVLTAGSTSFDFTARQAGTYRVSYTVTDGQTDATATARVTVLPADAPAQLSTAPVVAYVHPDSDVTLDVFSAVSNPTGRVLLLSDVTRTTASGASLSVDVVGQDYLRISGTTADGAPGPLGTVHYVVSDGTADVGSRITGEATVYLLPPASELAPIAVDDSVVVRVGAQVDIPVLDNDVAPSGSPITLNPASVRSSTPSALAFASGRVLRYLAPDKPGQYRVQYAVYASGAPGLENTATVHITVVSDESNHPPKPTSMEGRVLSGETTSIAFHSYGVDPDGDNVSLMRIAAQPSSGSATISADGGSIVYSSVPGFHGQVSFRYEVQDALGATGVATARIGVLDEEANPSPVTFTDYVDVQAGEANSLRVSPLANDIDPTGGTLSLTDVRPDAVRTLADGSPNPEYERLQALLGKRTSSQIVVNAGIDPGTMSFLYDVQSSTGNTARGLIVVRVVRGQVPDYPVVADTTLTAQSRERFPSGIDVVSGKVVWSGGDASRLTVSLWGDPAGVSVVDNRIQGAPPAHTRVIPFAVTGRGSSGQTVTSYGFLRVPGLDDLTLALNAGVGPQKVTEGSSVTWDMRSLVTAPRGMTMEVGSDATASGGRSGAQCTKTGDTSVRYDAGLGAPWADACVVPVRLSGQKDWTYLSVPISIHALQPQPELQPASLTIAPGTAAAYDLKTMTTWQGRTDWPHIVYSLQYAGSDFTIVQKGTELQITAADDAVPGAEDVAVVGVTSHAGVAPARLILRVGDAPSTLPRGGTVARQCSEASGSSCTFAVVGAPGEVNPLPRTPLRLVSVAPTGACTGVTFSVASSSSVTASWTEDAPGATCTASFELRDAQGRTTYGSAAGQILFDLQGYPQAPDAITQVAYGDGTVTLGIRPGAAQVASPALTGFIVRYEGRTVVTCTPDGVCPKITAPNGEPRVYTANAVNAVGESRSSVSVTAWAYDAPAPPGAVSWQPVAAGAAGGVIQLQVSGIDADQTGSLQISSPTGPTTTVSLAPGQKSATVPQYALGSNTSTPVTVTPVSRFTVPPGLDGTTSGSAVTVNANGVGAPTALALGLTSKANDDGTSTITANGTAASNGTGSVLRYGIVVDGDACMATPTGSSRTFVEPVGQTYTFRLCVESWYPASDGRMFARSETTASVVAFPSSAAPSGYTFVVDPTAGIVGNTARWSIKTAPTSPDPPPSWVTRVVFPGYPSTVYGSDPGIQAQYQWQSWTSASAPVTPAAGYAPYQVQASWNVSQCTGGSTLQAAGSSSTDQSGGQAGFTFDLAGASYFDSQGNPLVATVPGQVPVGAARVEGLAVTVSWAAQGWRLRPATATFGGTCDPNIPASQSSGQ